MVMYGSICLPKEAIMKQNYEPFTRSVRRQLVCPDCKAETTDTILMNKLHYNKMILDPFLRCKIMNVEKRCQNCFAEDIGRVLDKVYSK